MGTSSIKTPPFSLQAIPEIYTISEGQGINGPGYNIPYNNTPENSIMVYLGDLDGLPIEELHYFQAYNIHCPKEPLTEERFRRDFFVEFTEPEELEHHLKKNLRVLNQTFQSQFYFPLFKLSRVEVKDYLQANIDEIDSLMDKFKQ